MQLKCKLNSNLTPGQNQKNGKQISKSIVIKRREMYKDQNKYEKVHKQSMIDISNLCVDPTFDDKMVS